ncbi:hypothetical protein [Adhaeribacter soli]|uniref:Uncharacterized protein n=1 Tax=Adhaeribacter soli TaxID=2607655 RepID=A0A5N1J9D4_9BACT|nr:hypothetical protein [Adhaeribacter soli]KAA9345925.1 hypothetical protein F0P94_02250 [Adhaeribacter soli]
MENSEEQPFDNNEKNKSDVEFKKDQANGNLGDPTAKRNIGPNGIQQRPNQKDELDNLHIGGNEVTGYGDNLPAADAGENAAGPGFEAEGDEYTNDHPVKEE